MDDFGSFMFGFIGLAFIINMFSPLVISGIAFIVNSKEILGILLGIILIILPSGAFFLITGNDEYKNKLENPSFALGASIGQVLGVVLAIGTWFLALIKRNRL